MKKHITLALFIAVLLGVLSIGCNKQPSEKTSVGDTIVFGKYAIYGERDASPIEWYVLKNDTANHRVMLLAMDVVEAGPYHKPGEAFTWADSMARAWLNGYDIPRLGVYSGGSFITKAFTNKERSRIAELTVVNENNPQYGTPGGVNTQDKVFLLSIAEVQNLLGEDICTKIHCKIQWYLRSPGESNKEVAYVGATSGSLVMDGGTLGGFRPALWLNY